MFLFEAKLLSTNHYQLSTINYQL